MAMARGRRQPRQIDYWPGFVDALSTMLLAITFLLSVFMLGQFFLAREVTGKDTVLQKLHKQIDELTSLLALEKASKAGADSQLAALTATLDATKKDKAQLEAQLAGLQGNAGGADKGVL